MLYCRSRVYTLRTTLMKEFKTATFMFLPSQLSVHGKSAANSLSSKEAFSFESETTTKNAIYVGETSSKSDFLWLCWLTSNTFMAHYQFQSLGVHWSSNNEPVTGTNNHSLVFVSWHLGKFPVAFFYSLIKNTPCCLVCGLHSSHWGTKWAEREPAWRVWWEEVCGAEKPSLRPGSAGVQPHDRGRAFPLSGPCSYSCEMNSLEACVPCRF